MTRRIARPGDSILKHVTASQLNEWNKRRVVSSQFRPQQTENPVKIEGRVATSSGLIFKRFEPVNLIGPFSEAVSTFRDGMWETVAVEVDDQLAASTWGISQGLIQEGFTSLVTVVGLTWAKFDYTDGDTHVTVDAGNLVSSTSGEAVIIFPPPAVNEAGLILIRGGSGGASMKLLQGELKDLYPGQSGTEREGYTVGTVLVKRTTCDATSFKDQEIEVVDWAGCIFDHAIEDMLDVWVWVVEDWQENPDFGPYDDREFICGWATLNRCCVPADGTLVSGSGGGLGLIPGLGV